MDDGFRYGRFLRGLALLGLTIFLGSLGFVVLEGYSPLNGLYMTMITISTVGFGEVQVLSTSGRILVMGLIVVGLGLVTYTFGAIATLFLEGQIRKIIGGRIMRRELESLKDHFVVCGYGRMGSIVCEELAAEGRPFVVVTLDEQQAEKLQEDGQMAIFGDATEDDILQLAGVSRARALVATAGGDVDNLYITLSAREMSRSVNPNLYILARASDDKASRKIKLAGADRVVSPYRIGGSRLVQALLRPQVYDYMDTVMSSSGLELLIEELLVREGSILVGKAIRETNLRSEYDVIIIGVNTCGGEQVFNPGPDHVIEEGDTLIILGRTPQLQRLERSFGI